MTSSICKLLNGKTKVQRSILFWIILLIKTHTLKNQIFFPSVKNKPQVPDQPPYFHEAEITIMQLFMGKAENFLGHPWRKMRGLIHWLATLTKTAWNFGGHSAQRSVLENIFQGTDVFLLTVNAGWLVCLYPFSGLSRQDVFGEVCPL